MNGSPADGDDRGAIAAIDAMMRLGARRRRSRKARTWSLRQPATADYMASVGVLSTVLEVRTFLQNHPQVKITKTEKMIAMKLMDGTL